VATGKDRQRQLARQHYERQLARRAERMAKARRRRIIGSAVGAVVAVGAVAATTFVVVNGADEETSASAEASASASAEPKAFDPNTGTCGYVPDREGQVKDVGLPPEKADNSTPKTMTIKTNLGRIEIDLEVAKAPCTVNSFAHLASKDYFDDTKCHRLVTEGLHVLQCGDPLAKADGENPTDGTGGPGYRFVDENLGGMPYKRGVVAMANSGPNTNGSQFFIVYGDDTKNLQPNYTPFGTVTKGMDIVDKVVKAGVRGSGGDGAPKQEVRLEDVTISGKS
jgi:Peptidyl-prolyl cis-trans isomerase (rotamase) - cyclophilin family